MSTRTPRIDEGLCSLGRLAMSTCSACAGACPTRALTAEDFGLELDVGLCSGCGACAAQCPQRAIAIEGIAPFPPVRPSRDGQARLICPQRPGGSLCLQALGCEVLARLWLAGIRRLHLDCGDCSACVNGTNLRFLQDLDQVNALLISRGLPVMQVEFGPVPPKQRNVPLLADPTDRPTARRALFASLASPGLDFSALERLQSLRPTGQVPLFAFAPEIEATSCTGCDACIRVCPTGSMTLINTETGDCAYMIDAAKCSGCRLCQVACGVEAVQIAQMVPERAAVSLETYRCSACGVQCHQPVGHRRDDGLCPICARTRHHSRLFVVIP